MEALNKYLAATGHHLGIEEERYGGAFRAIVANRADADFLFDKLEGNDIEGTQAQFFLWGNPLFPAASGATPSEAIQKLDAKIAIMYRFESHSGVSKWKAIPQFCLRAECDAEPGYKVETYEVEWSGVIEDMRGNDDYFYDAAKEACTLSDRRNLHALVNFQYQGDFAKLRG